CALPISSVQERMATIEAERETVDRDIEQLDGQSSPLEERRDRLEDERRGLADKVQELGEARRGMQARKDLLDARRTDIEETPGSRFLRDHKGRAVGLLKDLVRIEPGLELALVAALGSLADAVVYEDGALALQAAPGTSRRRSTCWPTTCRQCSNSLSRAASCSARSGRRSPSCAGGSQGRKRTAPPRPRASPRSKATWEGPGPKRRCCDNGSL